jgi:hypothetical protein
MTRWTTALLVLAGLASSTPARAQDTTRPVGHTVVVSVIPGGGTFFTTGKNNGGPSFGNYSLGGAVAVNLTRVVGIEGEFGGTVGITQAVTGFATNVRTPNTLNYSGNIVISAPTRASVVPYATGGIGGLSMFDKAEVGVASTTTFLTGNVGGGVKWYAGRWGLRGDYRFVAVRSNAAASTFFGQDTRYGHRVYGAVLLNLGR